MFTQERMLVEFSGAEAGTEPLTWGQKAILQDMRESGNQFSMGGRLGLPPGSTVADAAARLSGLMSRHAALRMRLTEDGLFQEVAESGQMDLEILTVPDDASQADAVRYAAELMDEWPLARFDFQHDWPLRMAVVRHRDACLTLVWALSHLVADGGAHLLLLDDLRADQVTPGLSILDVARSEQEPHLRQISSRAMRYWETQLRDIPPQTFGEPSRPASSERKRYWQARFTSPAAHLALQAISRRTGTDASRATLAVIATAISRVTGVNPLTVKVMMNNRFRQSMASVIAPLAQNTVISLDVRAASIDEVVARARAASLTAGMRAYYDPDELSRVTEELDATRGYPAVVTCRINDQRAMVMRTADLGAVGSHEESTLTWLGPRENMHEQANILIENRLDVLSLHMMWDSWSLSDAQVEAILRGVEETAVAAA